jgi:hypothetical protein
VEALGASGMGLCTCVISSGGLPKGDGSCSGLDVEALGASGMGLRTCITMALFGAAMVNKVGLITGVGGEEGGVELAEGRGTSPTGCSTDSEVDARGVLA